MGTTYDNTYFHHKLDLSPNDLLLILISQYWYPAGVRSHTTFVVQETYTLSMRVSFHWIDKAGFGFNYYGHWGKFHNDERWFTCATSAGIEGGGYNFDTIRYSKVDGQIWAVNYPTNYMHTHTWS